MRCKMGSFRSKLNLALPNEVGMLRVSAQVLDPHFKYAHAQEEHRQLSNPGVIMPKRVVWVREESR
jgi:hypothetical protein